MLHDHDHKAEPWLCFQPSRRLSLEVLSTFIEIRSVTATPRLGNRTADHPKGYTPGQVAALFVHDESGKKHLIRKEIRIEAVTTKPLNQLTPDDLRNTVWYHNWEDVRRELSLFEKRKINNHEDISVVEFSYL